MENKIIEKYNRPIFFYGLSLLLPWIFWFIAVYLSHLPDQNSSNVAMQGVLGISGLLAPVFVAAFLFLTNQDIFNDLKERFFQTTGFPSIYRFYTFFLIFLSIVIAQLISILFGHSFDQFIISGKPSFSSGLFSPWFILIFAPVVEELAWHTYGTDTLRRKFNLFNTSLIFSVYWVIWHIPLSFIKGYYHSNVVAEGWIYSLNFIISLFVFVILMNWLYFKTKRNIMVAVIFHLSANISNEIFSTHPDSKVIQTILLLVVCIIVLIKEKQMFFSKVISRR